VAGFFQQFLKGAGDGFIGSPYLRDYQHGQKIFGTAAYANAPKFKWLFHVYFDINKYAIAGPNWEQIFPSTTNYGLMVKSVDLPKYTIDAVELNQYNRKRLIQTKIKYDPIKVVFHDDNANQIRQLWFNYFNYYYNDPSQPVINGNTSSPGTAATALNNRNLYSGDISRQQNWGYSGEFVADQQNNGSIPFANSYKTPFFCSIRVYGFNQHSWAMYELINPIIDSFGHDNYNYFETRSTMEHQMSIRYETVKYYEGDLNGQTPSSVVDGFARRNEYDTTLSPINAVGTNRTILGQGGLVDAGQGIISDLASGNYLRAAQTAARTGRTFNNMNKVISTAKTEVVQGVIGSVSRSTFNFPSYNSGARLAPVETRTPTPVIPAPLPPLP